MKRHVAGLFVAAALHCALVSAAWAQEQVITIENVQASVPVGVTVMVKKATVGPDATVVNLVVSFDSRQTGRVNLNDINAYLQVGGDQKLHLRQPRDNPYLAIQNGQSLEGDLVFPGRIPPDSRNISLVFNEGNPGDDVSAPGVKLDIALPERS